MKLLMPLEELEAEQQRRAQSRYEDDRFWNRRDTLTVLLAILCLAVGAAVCFAPLVQPGFAPVGNFSLQAETGLININTASLQALCSLPGIGEKKAQRIQEYIRENGPFNSLEELADVPGISANMIKKWQGLAEVR